MEGYMSIREAAHKWNVSERRVNAYIGQDRIPGVQRFGRSWAIPVGTEKPGDPRKKKRSDALDKGDSVCEEDLTFHMSQGRFNYRVGAIICHDGRFLLMKNAEAPYAFSIGGRVHYNETTEEAIIREVFEEIGIRMEIDRAVAFQEQFFDEKVTGEHFHEIALYYLMRDCKELDHLDCHSVTERGAKETPFWTLPEELDEIRFVPETMRKILRHLPRHMVRVVEKETAHQK